MRAWIINALLVAAVGCSSATTDGPPTSPAPASTDPGAIPPGDTPPGATPPGSSGTVPPPGPDGISVIVEPSDKAGALLSAIKAAKTSIHVTMYLLDDSRFVSALIAQHAAGRDVKVVLNQTFQAGAGTNAGVFNELQNAGVAVSWAPSGFSLTHEKCVIVDKAQAWIMTMNLEASSPTNREYLAVDTDPTDVAEAEAIFAADASNTSFVPTGNLVVAPTNARDKLLALIQTATKTVDVEGEELSDYKIVNALLAAKKAGATVRVVLAAGTPVAAQATAVQQLKAGGVTVVTLSSPYVHAKALVVDGARAYVGSANFTTGSLQYNRELGVITDNATTVGQVATTVAADITAGN